MEEDPLHLEQSFAAFELDALHRGGSAGHPAPFSCPTCGGTLWEAQDDSMLRFRCRVGHAFGAESLLQSETDRMDEALACIVRLLRGETVTHKSDWFELCEAHLQMSPYTRPSIDMAGWIFWCAMPALPA